MPHKFAHRWSSFLLIGPSGQTPVVVPDGRMDMRKIKDGGELEDGDHDGSRLTGTAIEETFVELTSDNSGVTYNGALVIEDGNRLVIAGTFLFESPRTFSIDGRELTQDDGTWVLTKP